MFAICNNRKIEFLVVAILIMLGLGLRLYAAFNVPLIYDEQEKITFLKQINLDAKNLKLPLGSRATHNPPLLPYLMKLSCLLFGENKIAIRLPSIILGTLTLLILYLLVRDNLSRKTALVTLALASFSQFFIASTRIAWEEGVLLFCISCVLLFVQKALRYQRGCFVILAGLFMGLGLLVKATMFTLLPVIVVYAFLLRRKENHLAMKHMFVFVLTVFLVISPSIFWNLSHSCPDYQSYFSKSDFLSFSLGPVALFLGEIIITGMYDVSDAFVRLICSAEYPFLNWLMGLICIVGAIFFLEGKKNNFIRLLLWTFYFNFLFFSLIRPKTGGGLHFHLDNFWWASASVIAGFILGAAMLVELSNRYSILKFILPLLILYFMVNAISFISFPGNCFIPRDSLKAAELIDLAEDYKAKGKIKENLKINNFLKRHYPSYVDF